MSESVCVQVAEVCAWKPANHAVWQLFTIIQGSLINPFIFNTTSVWWGYSYVYMYMNMYSSTPFYMAHLEKLRLSTRHLDSNTNLYARIEEAPQYSVHKYIYQKPLISKPSTLPALWADSLICGHKGQLSGKQLGRYQKLIAHVLISHLHNSIWCPTCMGNGQ